MNPVKPLALASLLLLAGCGSRESGGGGLANPVAAVFADDLTGCFASTKGQAPDLKFDKDGGNYYVSSWQNKTWKREKTALEPAPPEALKELFRDRADQIDHGIVMPGGGIGLFKMKPNAALPGVPPGTPYMALLVFGVGPVEKSACP